jgi:hypothetical protein
MASNTLDAIAICNDTTFRSRLRLIAASLARTALGEDRDVPFHNARAQFANSFLRRSDASMDMLCFVTAMDPAVALDSDDDVLRTSITTNFNVFSGAFNPAAEPTDGHPQEVLIEEFDHDNDPGTAPRVTRTIRNLFGLLR